MVTDGLTTYNGFTRDVPDEDRAVNQIHKILLSYPILHQCGGMGLGEILKDHDHILKDAGSLIAALMLLEQEKKIELRQTQRGLTIHSIEKIVLQ
jgi:precorrin-6B methylase 2